MFFFFSGTVTHLDYRNCWQGQSFCCHGERRHPSSEQIKWPDQSCPRAKRAHVLMGARIKFHYLLGLMVPDFARISHRRCLPPSNSWRGSFNLQFVFRFKPFSEFLHERRQGMLSHFLTMATSPLLPLINCEWGSKSFKIRPCAPSERGRVDGDDDVDWCGRML